MKHAATYDRILFDARGLIYLVIRVRVGRASAPITISTARLGT